MAAIWRNTLLSLSLSLVCTQSFALTIDQAWTAAKKTSPDYRIKQLEESKSQYGVSLSKSALLPSLQGSASSGWNKDRGSSNGYNISLTQSIWNSQNWSALDQSQVDVVIARIAITKAKNTLAEELIQAYFALAQAQRSLAIAEQQHKDSQQLLSLTEQRYKAGLIMSTGIDDAKAQVISTETTVLQRQSDLVEKQSALAIVINQTPDRVNEIDSQNLHQPALALNDEKAWLNKAKDNSPELLTEIQNVKRQQLAVDQAQAGYYPTVNGSVGYSNNFDNNSEGMSASLGVSVPIDLNGAIKTKVSQSKLELQIAKQRLRKVELNLENNVKTRFNQLTLDWKRVEMGVEKVKFDEKALKTKEILFDSGADGTTVLDIINVQDKVYRSKEDLQQLLYQYWLNRIELLKLTGQLNDQTITQISQALMP
ncbi:TolC family protein [Photobacterium leiognathi]|uniref:TolC family protein n=1 Tax=Photobacterium leiognathi TaxID=553611 RepID=UPI0002088A27|nr:TolC family protein [Photobacterium leiognathi]PSW52441.1 TolC family protein [Photobacterium leiognathi subsp. mandapamensis]GAA06743.1 outer membrane efflux family protein [Photobacterium leiognathi subsp. mandapamensis svers.1.1.]